MKPTRLVVKLAPLLLVASAHGQSLAALDPFIESEMKRLHIPGLAVCVIKDGKIVKEKGYGYSNLELQTPMTTASLFRIASVSKQMIASAVLLLAQEGKLSLDDPISKHLEKPVEGWSGITVRQLLAHTSGLAREMTGWNYYRAYTDAELMDMARKTKSDAAPGVQYSYSNTGYFLLGAIITRVSGEPWSSFIERRVFKPIGMATARLTSDDDIIPNRVQGYEWESERLVNEGPLRSVRTSGAFLCSIHDMALWAKELGDYRVLSASIVDRMWERTKLNDGSYFPYGFGWRIERERSEESYNHGGAQLGFRSAIYTFPKEKLSVVVLANSSAVTPYLLTTDIARFYAPNLRLTERKALRETDPARLAGLMSVLKPAPTNVLPDWAAMAEPLSWWIKSELGRFGPGAQRLELLKEEPGDGRIRHEKAVGKVAYYRVVGKEGGYLTVFMDTDGKPLWLETSRY